MNKIRRAQRRLSPLILACLSASLLAACAGLPGWKGSAAPARQDAVSPSKNPPADFGPSAPIAAPRGEPARQESAGESIRTFPGTGVFVNPKAQPAEAKPGPEEASLNFESLDVREAAKVILGDYLKESYTVHPAVTGTVTFRTIRPLARSALLPTLEMLLRQNNAAVVREEGIYKILPIAAVRGSVSPQLGGVSAAIPQGFSVVVVPVKFVSAREMARLLEPFAADNTVRIDEVRNLVIIAGNQREMRHLLDTVELFDVDWLAGYSVGLFPIKSADVKALVADLDKVFGAAGTSPLSGIVRVIPIERLNALLVVTTQPRYLEMAKGWVERLDQIGGTSGGSRFFVYSVRNGKAENLAQLLSDLFASRTTTVRSPTLAPGARPAQVSTPGFGQSNVPATTATVTTQTSGPTSATFQMPGGGTASSEVKVIADKDTNSLLILATPGDYDLIENALRKLDVARRQVLVEVYLAEVSLTDDLRFGINWFINARNNTSGTLNTGFLPPTAADLLKVPAFSGLQLINVSGGEVRAVLNALGEDSRSTVLASPQIMVLDNEKAEIKVGKRISVQTASQTGSTANGLINTFQYLETGILLAVTPRINSGGTVTLEVNQEVSEALPIVTAGANPDVTNRNAKTSVVVNSGESMVLAGLIRQNNSRSTEGLPLLSKIPVIGAAFGTQIISRERTELVLIITPRIVSDPIQAREATDELRRKMPMLHEILPKRMGVDLEIPQQVIPATR